MANERCVGVSTTQFWWTGPSGQANRDSWHIQSFFRGNDFGLKTIQDHPWPLVMTTPSLWFIWEKNDLMRRKSRDYRDTERCGQLDDRSHLVAAHLEGGIGNDENLQIIVSFGSMAYSMLRCPSSSTWSPPVFFINRKEARQGWTGTFGSKSIAKTRSAKISFLGYFEKV